MRAEWGHRDFSCKWTGSGCASLPRRLSGISCSCLAGLLLEFSPFAALQLRFASHHITLILAFLHHPRNGHPCCKSLCLVAALLQFSSIFSLHRPLKLLNPPPFRPSVPSIPLKYKSRPSVCEARLAVPPFSQPAHGPPSTGDSAVYRFLLQRKWCSLVTRPL